MSHEKARASLTTRGALQILRYGRRMSRLRCLVLLLSAWATGCTPASPQPGRSPAPAEGTAPAEATSPEARPTSDVRLVLWLTIDQMRGDFFELYGHHLTDGGMRRLLDSGLSYTAATHRHAITETAPGHATLFTGAAPREHGIIANSWLLPNGTKTFSVSDPDAPLLGPGASERGPKEGRSPQLLLVPTIGDAMVRQSGGKARVVSISLKDRGAILPAGQAGKAFWLGPRGFVTSSYYFQKAPPWLVEHDQQHPIADYLPERWELLRPEATYTTASTSSPPAPLILGNGFPHALPTKLGLEKLLKVTPFGDVATLDLAETALEVSELGKDATPDLLAISLSATDGIGHAWGPLSREAEDNFARLDRNLAEFFEFVDSRVGWSHVLVVLSSDHGGAEPAAELRRLGLRGARLGEAELDRRARELAEEEYAREDFILGVETPYVVLDRIEIQKAGRDVLEVRRRLADGLSRLPHVFRAHAVGLDEEPGSLPAQIQRSLHSDRSGDIYVVTDPYTLFLQDEQLVATHGSPWSYDSHVPLVMAGPGIPRGNVGRSVDVRSIAGTVAALLNITPPSAAKKELLVETFRRHLVPPL